MYPKSLEALIESFKFLPGIGQRTAERLAFSVLKMDNEKASYFSQSIVEARTKIRKCKVCGMLTDQKICEVCTSEKRDKNLLCVVEDPKIVFLIEKLGTFRGYYHILDGLISPLDGINPEDIDIGKLLERIKTNHFREIIIAVKPSIEGETTALYLKEILKEYNLKLTKIASGIPIGVDMEYIDQMTLERALFDRKEMS